MNSPGLSYRSEIDGLRAVAVLPVILFHTGLHWMPGGYVGVDIFFVISGFLITGILMRELEAGKFSILKFYERRARRILPALFFVMAVTAVLATTFMLPYELRDFGRSMIAVIAFISNIFFWDRGKIKIDDTCIDKFKTEKDILKKIGLVYRPYDTLPITGNYMERIRKYLKHFPWEMFYSVYRTEPLRKSFVRGYLLGKDYFVGNDASLVLNVLKYGEIQVVNDILLVSIPAGASSKGMMSMTRKYSNSNMGRIFPFYPLTKWCAKNLGWKIFLANIDHFLRLGLDGLILQIASIKK